jgi:DNA polymerase-3 subunit alpha
MSKFAEYAFNKSHAVVYAVIGYQTAWLKCYHPVEFMAATMSVAGGYMHECKKMGITLLPPDVNEGFSAFSVSEKCIRFGLSTIKNVGHTAVGAIVTEREKNGKYKGITDFIRRLADYDVNKRCLESLIRAGAFDSLGGKRSQYIAVHQNIQNGFAQQKKNTVEGQLSIFDLDDSPVEISDKDELPNMGEFPKRLLLHDEKTLLGIYVSGHPLAEYEETIRPHVTVTSTDFAESEEESEKILADGDNVKYGGIITGKSVKYTKADNKPFCFLTVEDMYGAVEVIVFSKIYEKFGSRLQEDQVLVIQGRVNVREEEATKLVAQDFLFYEEMPPVPAGRTSDSEGQPQQTTQHHKKETFWLKVPKDCDVSLQSITSALAAHPGNTEVMIFNEAQNKKYLANSMYFVTPSETLTQAMEKLLGKGMVKITRK